VSPLPQATINHRACVWLQEILSVNDNVIFTWSNALMEGFVTDRDELFIEPEVKDDISFILDHIQDFKALKLERGE
jgi:hypothetical protein